MSHAAWNACAGQTGAPESGRTLEEVPVTTRGEVSTALGRKATKAAKKADRKAAKAINKGEHGRITPGNAKRVVGIAKVVAPVLAPFALRGAAVLRERYDRLRARRLGVPVDQLGSFTGYGAALHARIAGDTEALRELSAQAKSADDARDVEQFVAWTTARMAQLTSAVRAAERMPPQRRRTIHRAVNAELTQLEGDLLTRFGFEPGR